MDRAFVEGFKSELGLDVQALRFATSHSRLPAKQGQLDNAVCVGVHEGHAFTLTVSETEILIEHELGLDLGLKLRQIPNTRAPSGAFLETEAEDKSRLAALLEGDLAERLGQQKGLLIEIDDDSVRCDRAATARTAPSAGSLEGSELAASVAMARSLLQLLSTIDKARRVVPTHSALAEWASPMKGVARAFGLEFATTPLEVQGRYRALSLSLRLVRREKVWNCAVAVLLPQSSAEVLSIKPRAPGLFGRLFAEGRQVGIEEFDASWAAVFETPEGFQKLLTPEVLERLGRCRSETLRINGAGVCETLATPDDLSRAPDRPRGSAWHRRGHD
jgi:hypothetical protein